MSSRLLWLPIVFLGVVLLIGAAFWYWMGKNVPQEAPIQMYTEAEKVDILKQLRASGETPVPKEEKIETLEQLRVSNAPESTSDTSDTSSTENKLKTLQMLHGR